MGFKCGIVGLPNVGKSTLFNAITQSQIEAANFPFCTIEPNVGIVPVPDDRLERIGNIAKSEKIIPTTIEFVDIAGLVAGASQGEGLGNKFLGNIRNVDAVAQVVRCFEDSNITHVSGKVSPSDDIQTINTELILSDLEVAQSVLDKAKRRAKGQDKEALDCMKVLEKIIPHLNQAQPVRSLELSETEKHIIRPFGFLSAKPLMYIANTDETMDTSLLDHVASYAEKDHAVALTINAQIEAEISRLDAAEQREFLEELGLEESGLSRVIKAGYHLLNLQTFFTAGPKETRAWSISKSCTAPQAAGKIHTDMQRGFIKADIISFAHYIKYQGETSAKNDGKLRSEGKEYLVEDGDIIHFKFNV